MSKTIQSVRITRVTIYFYQTNGKTKLKELLALVYILPVEAEQV